jgi:tRNA 2-thiouridine synthesizing protein A
VLRRCGAYRFRRHRGDAGLNKREHRAERRQACDALAAGIDRHRNYDKDLRGVLRLRSKMTEKTLNLRGLKCPLPALRTRKALSQSQPGDVLIVECTDPLAGIDIPNLLHQTGDTLEDTRKEKKLLTFRIRKV